MGIVNNTKARSIVNEISKRNPSKFKVAEIPGRGKPGEDTSISHVTPEYGKEPGSPAKVAPAAAAAAGGGAGAAGGIGGLSSILSLAGTMNKGGGNGGGKPTDSETMDIDTAGGPKRTVAKRVPSTYDAKAATGSLDFHPAPTNRNKHQYGK
tara:strand:+ start:569 stop:1024 length:456 start_codon:yes stop_codon:yes gene_type:complete